MQKYDLPNVLLKVIHKNLPNLNFGEVVWRKSKLLFKVWQVFETRNFQIMKIKMACF